MPDANGRFRPVAIPRVPWHEPPKPILYERCLACGGLNDEEDICVYCAGLGYVRPSEQPRVYT